MTRHVILLDDDEKLNALLVEYLGRFGFTVRAFVHPNDALQSFKSDPLIQKALEIFKAEIQDL